MRVIVPGLRGWQSSVPIQMTRSANASLRATAVFMTMPPNRSPKEVGSMGDAQGTARPFPLRRLLAARDVAHRSMFGYRPPNISHTHNLNRCTTFPAVARVAATGYDLTCLAFCRCRIRSPTICICSTSSSVISTPANWSSIAIINSTRSRKSAPRSYVKCVSLVTDSMSTPSCLATRMRTSLMERHSFKGVAP